jgi:ubiquinone/menaquinone biosynthesis C-methylase UbiE
MSKLSTIASVGGSNRSSESGTIRLVMIAPPIIDGGWFQALTITNRIRKSSIRERITRYNMEELVFDREAAAEYDRAFAHVTRYFMPFVLRAARVARGMHVLDIAAGTGLSAEAALSAVGPTGHVTAADVSPAMAEKARERLGEARNVSVLVEDAQALSFPNETFDVVVCNLGLMFFPEPAQGLSEFRRVLRPSGRAAVSVNTVPKRSYNHQINVILTRYVPGLAEAVTRTFSLGEESRLEELFRECGFSQIETRTVKHTFVLPSFDAYYGPFERGGASTGQTLARLPDDIRRAVREEVRRDVGDTGGPIEIEAEYRIASGRR